jgi:hypothetical protein
MTNATALATVAQKIEKPIKILESINLLEQANQLDSEVRSAQSVPPLPIAALEPRNSF